MESLDFSSEKKSNNSVVTEARWPKESELIFEEIACPICDSRNYFTVWKELAEGSWFRSGLKKEVQVVKCRTCGFIFTNPRPTMATRMLFYDPKTNPDLINRKAECSFDFRQQLRWLSFYYEIVNNIGTYKTKGKLLEIGVAGGGFLLTASDAINHPNKPLNFQLEGVAAYDLEAEQARRVTGFTIHNTKIEDWETANRYDVIACINVLEHIPNLNEFITKIHTLLEDEGLFVFVVPNNSLFDLRIKLNKNRAMNLGAGSIMACEHINHFTPKTINKLVMAQKFRHVEFRPVLVPRTRYWEKETIKKRLPKYVDYFLTKYLLKKPLFMDIFGAARK